VTGKLVLENLKHRPLRTMLSTLLIGVSVTLILTLVGLSFGLSEESQNRQSGVGADIVIRGSTAASVISFSPASIPEAAIGVIEQQPHVKMATGIIIHSIDFPLVATGVDLTKFNAMSGGFTYLAGHGLQKPGDILIDKSVAQQKEKQVGDTISLTNLSGDWRIAGIIDTGKLTRVAVSLNELQRLDDVEGKVAQIYVKVDDPANIQAVIRELKKKMPGYDIKSMEEYLDAFSITSIKGVKPFLTVMIGVGVFSGFITVWLSMYMVVLQRTREIGILKALGASKTFIMGIIEMEALIIGFTGTIVGILFSFVAYWFISHFVPASIPMLIKPAWWPIAAVIALIASALGALYPGLSAARHDPIEALAYE
jgi:putative ABC transport system permease protein